MSISDDEPLVRLAERIAVTASQMGICDGAGAGPPRAGPVGGVFAEDAASPPTPAVNAAAQSIRQSSPSVSGAHSP
jgi:hypothetical protein